MTRDVWTDIAAAARIRHHPDDGHNTRQGTQFGAAGRQALTN